jgi:ubiquitin-conjugating enzyme (huntingtin interacting protein 2)
MLRVCPALLRCFQFLRLTVPTVAKHYTTSRASFDDTARYWAEIYAGAPPRPGAKPAQKPSAGGKGGKQQVRRTDPGTEPIALIYTANKAQEQRDEIAIAGLERAHVEQFETLGFERTKVVRPFV